MASKGKVAVKGKKEIVVTTKIRQDQVICPKCKTEISLNDKVCIGF